MRQRRYHFSQVETDRCTAGIATTSARIPDQEEISEIKIKNRPAEMAGLFLIIRSVMLQTDELR
jgi:hypothetical protein